jgi:hypothetical protein
MRLHARIRRLEQKLIDSPPSPPPERDEPSVLDCLRDDPATTMRLAGMPPDPWQEGVLRSDARDTMLLCSRGAGKSQVVAAKALHAALVRPGFEVMIISRSQDQSDYLFGKIRRMYEALRALPGGLGVPGRSNIRQASLHLDNGSVVWPMPMSSNALVGYHVNLLVIDEASRIPDAVYLSCLPTVKAKKGKIVVLSTPFGRRGWFYREWEWIDEQGQKCAYPDHWHKVKVAAGRWVQGKWEQDPACNRPDRDEVAKDLKHGHLHMRQEYGVEFVDTTEAVFLQDQIDAAFRGDYPGWFAAGEVKSEASKPEASKPEGYYAPWFENGT